MLDGRMTRGVLNGGWQRTAFAAIARARAATARARQSFAAPRSLEAVNRNDVGQMFHFLRSRDGATAPGGRVDKLSSAVDRNGRPWRPQYVWSVLSAAKIAQGLGIERITAIEFGVAGGNGLLALETAADGAEELLGVQVDVFGFDTGSGMPEPEDHRDAPFSVREGQFGMDVDKLRARLRRAELVLGPVGETVPEFLSRAQPPIGFVSVDLDYYSSTMDAFRVLEAESDRLLPRVFCYFQGVLWHPWTEFIGQRAAINDFNGSHEQRKLSPIHGLRYALPASERPLPWPEMMYVAEIFDHELYNTPQGVPPLDTSLR
jgi:hypothetical protein